MALTTVSIGTGSGGFGTTTVRLTVDFVSATIANPSWNPPVLTNANAPGSAPITTLSSGANTITVPSLAGGVVFIPPTDNASVTLTLKGVSGDTGISISGKAWTVLTFPATPPASFVINASGSLSGCYLIWL
ncbi:MAG TPA: hypothetical protein VEI97_05150 [bacterium]|nr:hypothetical protein [bacterium]